MPINGNVISINVAKEKEGKLQLILPATFESDERAFYRCSEIISKSLCTPFGKPLPEQEVSKVMTSNLNHILANFLQSLSEASMQIKLSKFSKHLTDIIRHFCYHPLQYEVAFQFLRNPNKYQLGFRLDILYRCVEIIFLMHSIVSHMNKWDTKHSNSYFHMRKNLEFEIDREFRNGEPGGGDWSEIYYFLCLKFILLSNSTWGSLQKFLPYNYRD